MKRFSFQRLGLLAGLLLVGWLFVGCASTEPNNRSARPWNSPKGWETGLPAGLNEGR